MAGWKVPQGDNGHWKVVDGVIDYDAQSEAKKDKHLWTEDEYGDFVLRVDWRLKETPYTNPRVKYVLPDGTNARDTEGKELNLALPDSDSGIILRGDMKNQVNIWCWPSGSGEVYGYRTDASQPAEIGARRYVHRSMVVLLVRRPARRAILITPDMLPGDSFRRLRVWALWGRLPVAAVQLPA